MAKKVEVAKEEVQIKCEGAGLVDLEALEDFQGNLKTLSDDNYRKLKKEIMELGFSAPFFVWKHEDKHHLLDGHQRRKTLVRMQEEGIVVPPLPVVWVQAKNISEAKKKLLAITSKYGKMNEAGLAEFIRNTDLEFDDLLESYDLDVDMSDLKKLLATDEMDMEFDDLDESGVPDVDISGEIPNTVDYLILTMDDGENSRDILKALGITNNTRRMPYKEFVQKIDQLRVTTVSGDEDEF